MKNTTTIICLLLTLFLYSHYSYAQKVEYDDDTVKVDGRPFAIMKKKSAGPMRSDFIVSGLSGTELLYFKSMLRTWMGSGFRFGQGEELYFEAYFIATGNRAELKHYTGKGFSKLLVDNNLIKGNAIDPESEKRFVQLHNGTLASTTPVTTSDKAPAVIVNINNNSVNSGENHSTGTTIAAPKSKSPVILDGNKIMRDDNVIGKFRQDTTSSTYSQKSIIILVYIESGEKVAEASAPITNPQEWSIKILSENKSYNIIYDSPNERENLFKWLADKNYLLN